MRGGIHQQPVLYWQTEAIFDSKYIKSFGERHRCPNPFAGFKWAALRQGGQGRDMIGQDRSPPPVHGSTMRDSSFLGGSNVRWRGMSGNPVLVT